MKIYENGNLYQVTKLTGARPYSNLNFNPIRVQKYIGSSSPLAQTRLSQVYFNDSDNDTFLSTFVKGTSDNYFLGCFLLNDSGFKQNQLVVDSDTSYYDQCKQLCLATFKQMFLIYQQVCACVTNMSVILINYLDFRVY